jgi:glycosyltransferase involved in cell wall biosynthesis
VSDRAGKKIVVVMPAHNAAKTLSRTVSAIPPEWVDDIILVDDKSSDDTVTLARGLELHVLWHPHNVGYGGNQKTCYLEALQRGADVVVMVHPDGQYDPTLIPEMVRPILAGEADLVMGSRLAVPGMALKGGMPRHKFVINRMMSTIQNLVLRTGLSELHSGYRAYSRELLLTVPFLRNSLDFSFDSEMLAQAVMFDFRLAEVPAPTRYFQDASSIGGWPAVVYALKTLRVLPRFVAHKLGLRRDPIFLP